LLSVDEAAPKANGVPADDEGLAGSGALAPNPPKGLPAGVVEPAGWPNEKPADFSVDGVAGAPKAGAAFAGSAAGVLVEPNEKEALGASVDLAGSAAAGAPKVNGFGVALAAGAGVVVAG
jgi:hypothetical protein